MNKTLLTTALALGIAGGAQASDITVGGVTWDPQSTVDFGASFDFTQWFTTDSTTALSDADRVNYAPGITGLVSPGTIASGSLASGTELTGVGEFTSINGEAVACSGCELTLAFGGLEITGFVSEEVIVLGIATGIFVDVPVFNIDNAWLNVYVSEIDTNDFNQLAVYDEGTDSFDTTQIGYAVEGDLWLAAEFDSFAFQTSSSTLPVLNGTSQWTASIVSGAAFSNFDTNSQISGSDVFSGETGATFGSPTDFDIAAEGTGSVEADTIPEPGSLALIGVALLGAAGLAARRKPSESNNA